MNKKEFQEIKDSVDEAKLEVGSREYPSLSWLGWIVANVPLLITAVEELQAENEQLEERDEMAKRLADYCRMTIETGELNYGSSIAVAYRDYMAMREEQKESKE